MNHLHRGLAPISDTAWRRIDDEAREALQEFLAARRLVDFSGPHGWDHAAVSTGAVEPVDDLGQGSDRVALRSVLQLIETRMPFRVDREVLRQVDRGAPSVDLSSVIDACRRAAALEDSVAFDGLEVAGVAGCDRGSDHKVLTFGSAPEFVSSVAEGMAVLQDAGVEGPYGLALGAELWRSVVATIDGGYPVLKHLDLVVNGPVVRARTVDGAVLLSQRGGDFELVVGGDFAIGYSSGDAESVELYVTETFTFRNNEPSAAVGLRPV
jgi:uncharacterized linocin/CFP29 family protein